MAGYIDQIETGSKTVPFQYLEYIEINGKKYTENNSGCVISYARENIEITVKFKPKIDRIQYEIDTTNIEPDPKSSGWTLQKNVEYTAILKPNYSFGRALLFGIKNAYDEEYNPPDFFFILSDYEGE